MTYLKSTFIAAFALLISAACSTGQDAKTEAGSVLEQSPVKNLVVKSEEEWKAELSPVEYHILREKGTERAFTGEYNDFKGKGTFTCAACGNPLFDSKTKYDSRSGWPSFYTYATDTSLLEVQDLSYGMVRTEVVCARCEGHLGHVFPDGPQPTGLRYCINSVSLGFLPEEK